MISACCPRRAKCAAEWTQQDALLPYIKAVHEFSPDHISEDVEFQEHDLSPSAPAQIERLDVNQLAIWISAAPEPQRTALALFYLDEFNHREILSLAELKIGELSRLLANGRRQFQAWLNTTVPQKEVK